MCRISCRCKKKFFRCHDIDDRINTNKSSRRCGNRTSHGMVPGYIGYSALAGRNDKEAVYIALSAFGKVSCGKLLRRRLWLRVYLVDGIAQLHYLD